MSNLTESGRAHVAALAQRYRLSEAAIEHMARAVANGGGTMAQFNCPELGGSGQWMAGGMTMVGNMFDTGLQNTVSNLCGEIANLQSSTRFFVAAPGFAGRNAWPEWLGAPAASGGQNQARYAYFPQARRLAFDHGDGRPLTLLDTGDHQIGGFSQQQSGPGDPFMGVSVASQFGQFALSSFPRVDGGRQMPARGDAETSLAAEPTPAPQTEPETVVEPAAPKDALPTASAPADASTILDTIERLANLRDAGAISKKEYEAKKAELLARL